MEKQKPARRLVFALYQNKQNRLTFEPLVLPTSYFPDNVSIIAAQELNFSVRNGKRCDPLAKSGELRTQIVSTHERFNQKTLNAISFIDTISMAVIVMFPNRIRVISKPRLNTLLCVHLAPINVIVSYDPSTNTYLEVGFVLRCFQNLSIPDIATGRSSWR